MIVLECLKHTDTFCVQYAFQFPFVDAIPVFGVFFTFAIGLLLGRSVWG